MAKKSETPTRTINLLKRELEVPQPYVEGHTITAVEAKVLNQSFSENIANNCRAMFKKIDNGDEDAMPEGAAIDAFNEYAASYAFTEAAVSSRQTLTPVEKESRKIAAAIVMQKAREQGKRKKDIEKEKFDAAVTQVAEHPDVKAQAEKNVAEMQKLSDIDLTVG